MGGAGKGERSFANWDEDSITMAVEASRLALAKASVQLPDISLDSLRLASTSLPFADRNNAGIVREALNLNRNLSPLDLGGSRRAATAGLLDLTRRGEGTHLLCASDCVDTLPASETEPTTGHGAAAILLGTGQPVASLCASASLHEDFVDRYRMSERRFDYQLESRWIRDAGTLEQLGSLVAQTLEEGKVKAQSLAWLLLPFDASLNRSLARKAGLAEARTADELAQKIGICGAAHPMIMLAWALEHAQVGDHILLAGAGQGFDVLLFEVTPGAAKPALALAQQLAQTREEKNYTRYLGIRQLLAMDSGIRSERDTRTALSAHYRRHEDLTGFNGGYCSECKKLQFPLSRYCVHCHSRDSQTVAPMSELDGEVNSYTEDWLAYSPSPPLMFGNIHFPGGANVMMEFSDFLPGELHAGDKVRMSFRIKDLDARRGFKRYFWKPTPAVKEHAGG